MNSYPTELKAGLHLIGVLDFRHSFKAHTESHFPNIKGIYSKLGYSLAIDSAVASLFITGSVDSRELWVWGDGFDSWLWEQRKIEPEYYSNVFSG